MGVDPQQVPIHIGARHLPEADDGEEQDGDGHNARIAQRQQAQILETEAD